MNFILELIVDMILELVVNGTFEIATTRKVPLWGRIIFLLVVMLVYGALIGAIAMIGIDAWQRSDQLIAIILFGIDIAILIWTVYLIRKIYIKNSEKNDI